MKKIIEKYSDAYGFCKFNSVENYLINCRNISKIPQNAQTIITILFPYYLGEEAYIKANVSRYAVVPDYHDVVNVYLEKIIHLLKENFPKDEFVSFTDNSPIPEVYTASICSLGCVGKNGLLINEKYGSWVFIGEIVTTLKIDEEEKEIKHCISCNKCQIECPTGALDNECFEKNLCLSHITQKKGEIPEEYREMMIKFNCAWGCDICQKVCPMNEKVEVTKLKEFVEESVPKITLGCDIHGRAFAWRGEKVIERNLQVLEQKS